MTEEELELLELGDTIAPINKDSKCNGTPFHYEKISDVFLRCSNCGLVERIEYIPSHKFEIANKFPYCQKYNIDGGLLDEDIVRECREVTKGKILPKR